MCKGKKLIIMLFFNAYNNNFLLINKIRMAINFFTISINNLNGEIIFFTKVNHFISTQTLLILWLNICNTAESLENIKTAIVFFSIYILNSTSADCLN